MDLSSIHYNEIDSTKELSSYTFIFICLYAKKTLYNYCGKFSHTQDTRCFGFTVELQVGENCETHVEKIDKQIESFIAVVQAKTKCSVTSTAA